jgi:hypothetical protein
LLYGILFLTDLLLSLYPKITPHFGNATRLSRKREGATSKDGLINGLEPAPGGSTYRSAHPSDVRTTCRLLEEAKLINVETRYVPEGLRVIYAGRASVANESALPFRRRTLHDQTVSRDHQRYVTPYKVA